MPGPYVNPADCLVLRQMDRLRELVEADAEIVAAAAPLWDGDIRDHPTDPATDAEEVLAAIFVEGWNFAAGPNRATLGKPGVRRVKTAPRIVIDVKVREPQAGAVDHSALYRQCVSVHSAILAAVEKVRQDPTVGDSLWYGIEFGVEPVTSVIQHLPQVGYQATAIIQLNSQHTND